MSGSPEEENIPEYDKCFKKVKGFFEVDKFSR